MVPRIQHHLFLRLAQRQGSSAILPVRYLQARPSIAVPQSLRLRPFTTSPARRQEPRQPAVPEPPTPATEPADPTATATATATTTPPTLPPPPPTPSPLTPAETEPKPKSPKPKPRLAPRLLLALAFTLLGLSGGSSLRLLLAPPELPAPHTEHDAYTIRVLHEQAAALPVVQQLDADPAAWESWDAYASLSDAHKAQHIAAGALAGSRGVGGFQRVWRNKMAGTGEVVSVVYFGGATAGWPGVVHGGCLATLLDESCGRAAFQEWKGRPGLTASLGLEYKRVTLANGFYVIRTRVRPDEELPEEERGKRHYKCWVDATVEDAVTGGVTVVAEALFVGGEGKNKNGGQWGGEEQELHARF